MDTGTVAFERTPKWDGCSEKVKATRSDHLYLPRGVFVLTEKNHYHPTLALLQPADFYSHRLNVALVAEERRMNDPATLNTLGCFYTVVTNTGRYTLNVGDQFTLEWPTQADLEAQYEATRFTYHKQSHQNVSELMWDYRETKGFLATVPNSYHVNRMKLDERLSTELSWRGSRGLLYSLGRVQEAARYVTGNDTVQQDDTDFLTPMMAMQNRLGQLTEQQLRGRIANAKDPLKELAMACCEVTQILSPRVVGVVETSVIGNENKIPTGAQFKAFIMFK